MKYAALNLLCLPVLFACHHTESSTPHDPSEVQEKMIRFQMNFDELDRDGNGLLSREELRLGMIRSGVEDPSEHQVSKVMRFYDFNRDGNITLREVQSGTVTGPDALIRDAG
jgi:Ca2+-binding EF-hand superfamily protein